MPIYLLKILYDMQKIISLTYKNVKSCPCINLNTEHVFLGIIRCTKLIKEYGSGMEMLFLTVEKNQITKR